MHATSRSRRTGSRKRRRETGARIWTGSASSCLGLSLVLAAAPATAQVYQLVAGDQTVLFHYQGADGLVGNGDDATSSDLGTVFSFDPNYVGSWSSILATVVNAAADPVLPPPYNLTGFLHSGSLTVDPMVAMSGGGPLVTGGEVTATVLGLGQIQGQLIVTDGSYDPGSRAASLVMHADVLGASSTPFTLTGEAFVVNSPFAATGDGYVDSLLAPRAQALGASSLLFLDVSGADARGRLVRLVAFGVSGVAGVGTADLQMTKTSDAGMLLLPGGIVVFTLTVTNNGPGSAAGVVVTDLLPPALDWISDDCGAGPPVPGPRADTLTWSVGALANGASAVCEVTVEVAAEANAAVENAAYALATSFDPTISDNLVGESVEVEDDGPNGLRQDPNHLSGFPSDLDCDTCAGVRQRMAENFAVNRDDTHFAGIEFFGAYTDDIPFADVFTVEIYDSLVKTPGLPPTPGGLVASITDPVVRLTTGDQIGGLDEYEYRIIAPFSLDRGQYWLMVYNDSSASGGSGDWFWETASVDTGGRSLANIVATGSPPGDVTPIWNLSATNHLAVELVPTHAPMPNLFANGDFDQGMAFWDTSAAGSWSVDSIDGNEAPGSYAPSLDCTATFPDSCTISQCVDVSGLNHPATFDYGIAVDNGDGSVSQVGVSVLEKPTADCSGFGLIVDFATVLSFPTGWTRVDRSFTTSETAQSVAVSFTIFGTGALVTGVDDAVLQALTIFADGFESGDVTLWDGAVP